VHRLHPALLVHTQWVGGRRRLAAQGWAGRPPLLLNHPLALRALSALPAEFDRDRASAAWRATGVPEDAHGQLWSAFTEAGLFTETDGDRWWDEFGWGEARAYHKGTRDYPFLEYAEPGAFVADTQRMHEYRDHAPTPPVYQRLGGEDAIALPRLGIDESPDECLERLTNDQRRSVEGVGLLFDVCFGERDRIRVADGSTCLLKSIPSGGARHPTEVFLGAFSLEGIPPGIYHYDVGAHALEQVRAGDHRDAFARATLDLFSKHDTAPAAALVFTSLVERAMWRYRDPRSFRAILVDVGHAVMAYRRVARMLGFRTYAYQKMRDSEVASLVGVDRIAQPPLYVGTLVP
jgi:SagB-type dehydrogenase family enzyme